MRLFFLPLIAATMLAILPAQATFAFSNNNVIELDSASGYGSISTTDDNVFDIGDGSADTSAAIAAWINLDTISGITEIFSFHTTGTNDAAGRRISLYVNGSGKLNFGVSDGTNLVRCYHPTTLSTNQWHHVAGTFDSSSASELTVWLDGVKHSYTSNTSECTVYPGSTWNVKINTNTNNVAYVGAYSGSSFYKRFDGELDDLAVWGEALTDAELQSIYNDGHSVADVSTVKSSNLLAYWNMNETSGSSASDSSGNNTTITWNGTYSHVSSSWDVTPTATITPANSATNIAQNSTISIAFDYGVREADDSTLLNAELSNYITLKDTNSSGTDISYSATISSDKKLITITPSSNFSSAQTVYVALSSGLERSDNAVAATSSTFTVAQTPSMTISAAEVTSGATSNDATLALTFTSSEATSDFIQSDIQLTNASLSAFSASSATTYTATLTPTSEGAVTVKVAANAYTGSTSNNGNSASQFDWTYSTNKASPLNKADVIGLVEAKWSATSNWAQTSQRAIHNRLQWLRRHADKQRRSKQGITLDFGNQHINNLLYSKPEPTTGASLVDTQQFVTSLAGKDLGQIAQASTTRLLDGAVYLAQKGPFGRVDLNPVTGDLYKGWAGWSSGRIAVGDLLTSNQGATIELDSNGLFFGLDRITPSNQIVGFSIGVGQDDFQVGTSGSAVTADNFSIATYMQQTLSGNATLSTNIGYGHLHLDTTRIDGNQTLKGTRKAHQIQVGATIDHAEFAHHNLWVKPYASTTASYSRLASYSESGGDLALHFKHQNMVHAKVALGLDINGEYKQATGVFTPHARLEYGVDKTNTSHAEMRYVDETIYYAKSAHSKTEYTSALFGFDIRLNNGVTGNLAVERKRTSSNHYYKTYALKLSASF